MTASKTKVKLVHVLPVAVRRWALRILLMNEIPLNRKCRETFIPILECEDIQLTLLLSLELEFFHKMKHVKDIQ